MHYIRSGRNVRIAVNDINSAESRDCVVFIHGWPLDNRIFEYQYVMLAERNIRCIGIDLRGFGQSDTPGNGYSYDHLAWDVHNVLTELRLSNIILAGFSMGGAVAVRYVANHGGRRLRKLALLSAAVPSFVQRPGYPHGMTRAEVDEIINLAKTDRPKMVVEFGKNFFGSQPSMELSTWFRDIGWSCSGIGTIATAESLRDEDLRGDLEKINVPTGIFHGTLDKICPYEFAILMKDGIRDATLHTFNESGHAIFYDELQKFNKEFLEFITK